MNKADYAIFIGRMQPPTKAHKALIEKCFEIGKEVIIVIGSATESRSTYLPFTAHERSGMVQAMFPDKKIHFIHQPDSNMGNDEWRAHLKEQVEWVVRPNSTVKLVGCNKDATSFYLSFFPEWKQELVAVRYNGLSATAVRDAFYRGLDLSGWYENVDPAVEKFIREWVSLNPKLYTYLREWHLTVWEEYIEPYSGLKWAQSFQTGDSLLRCCGHVLVITRDKMPGLGQLALPGGFLDVKKGESIRNCALRELDEEASIGVSVPMDVLHANIDFENSPIPFDNAHRDTRGRYITHVYQIKLDHLDELPVVKAADDARKAEWIPESDFYGSKMNGKFYADHLKIIRWFLGITLKESI